MLDATAPIASARQPRKILAVLLLAGVSFALSQTMVIPALPALSRSLGAGASSSSWLLTGYLLSASVATPIVGKLGDLYGKGRTLTIVLLLFSVGAVVCALGTSIGVVIAGRVIQGVAGGVFPLAFGIIRDTFPREKVASGLGLLSAIFGIGGGIGLPLAGVVVDHLDISWIFWSGLIALPAALAAHRLVPASPTAERARIDWLGAGLLSAGLVAVLLGVSKANDWGWGSATTVGLFVSGLATLAVWVRVEATRAEPLIDLRVLRQRAVAATNLTGLLVGFAMFASFLLIPQFAQAPEGTGYGFGLSVTQSGLLIAPAAFVQLLVGPVVGSLGTRFGFRSMLALGGAFVALSFVVLSVQHSHPWDFVISGALLGAGISLALASMANLIVDVVRQSEVGIATGINTVMRTVGGAFGAAVATAILTSTTIPGSPLPTEGAYEAAFLVSAGGGLLALGAALLIPTRRAAAAAADALPAPAHG
jgi:EmrB/QacA subfamily drug resistance transporter